jgi:TrmH family RNA methyltransferase
MPLTSSQNPLLKKIRRATADGRPTPEGWLVIEGPHLLAEALDSPWELGPIVTTPEGRERYAELLDRIRASAIEIPARAFSSITSTESAQQILALLRPRLSSWRDLIASPSPALLVVLDGIQDPGNAGTIVRSAEAFGASGVVLLEGCVHPANGKFLRATAGSLFRLPWLDAVPRARLIEEVRGARLKLYALTSRGNCPLSSADLGAPCALVVGSEARGVSSELLSASIQLAVATRRVESLNAAVACSVVLFEAARQRGLS